VAKGAELGVGVRLGPYAIIGPRVRLADGGDVQAHAVVHGWTEVGARTVLCSHAVAGGPPQDLKYNGEDTRLVIGEDNMIREGVTLNTGTVGGGGITRIGSKNILMANSHVAHDCSVGSNVILANNVMLAGHVHVEDGAILNGGVGVHHFTTIGRLAYVGGLSRITRDVPPFMITEGHPSRVRGTNVIGLKRAGVSEETVNAVKEAFKLLYRSDLPGREAFDRLRQTYDDPLVTELVDFVEASMTGRHGRRHEDRGRGLTP
jgi:UDP-N-acetylglucosamine acyltransferase